VQPRALARKPKSTAIPSRAAAAEDPIVTLAAAAPSSSTRPPPPHHTTQTHTKKIETYTAKNRPGPRAPM